MMLVLFKLQGQELPSEVNIIPPSPNVMAFNKFIDIPVSYYTGTPNISVSIYEIQMQQLSLPISLNYHASGLKVEEHASWVGAGWALSAGGVISRTVRGLPDEYLGLDGKKGYFYNDGLFLANGELDASKLYDCTTTGGETYVTTPEEPVTIPDSLAKGFLDLEPDMYSFSFPGGSGKFLYDRSGNIIRTVVDDVKFITHPFPANGTRSSWLLLPSIANSTDYQWVLKGTDGTQYTFTNAERTTTKGHCGTSESPYDSPIESHQSSWHLYEISNNGEWIRFEYEGETIIHDTRISTSGKYKVAGIGSAPGNPITVCYNDMEVQTKRLKEITTSNGYKVIFHASTER